MIGIASRTVLNSSSKSYFFLFALFFLSAPVIPGKGEFFCLGSPPEEMHMQKQAFYRMDTLRSGWKLGRVESDAEIAEMMFRQREI